MALDDAFVSILFVADLPDVTAAAFKLIAELESKGAIAAAAAVERATAKLFQELEGISVTYAKLGTDMLRKEEEDTRVRPPTGFDAEMAPFLRCDPLPEIPGSVGVVNKDVIDNSPADWWWTNEIGYSGHVGRELHGYFYEAGFVNRSAPGENVDPREHPLFRPSGPFGPPMTIHEPIPARRFVLKALDSLQGEWVAAVERALSHFQVSVMLVMEQSMEVIYAPIP